jgi:SAM-dependent methyltransferase
MYNHEMGSSKREISDFINSHGSDLRFKLLTLMDPARVISLMYFWHFFKYTDLDIQKIAVVSGSMNEPELEYCPTNAKITVLSYEDDPYLFDLSKDWTKSSWKQHQQAYDLVLCEHVLEHCLDPAQAFNNLATLLKPGGILHVSVPAINNSHGEPHYFYAGFPKATLVSFAENANLDVLICDSWKSDKASRMYATCDWAPIAASGPLNFSLQALKLCGRNFRAVFGILLGRLNNFRTYPFQDLFKPSKNGNATCTWLFAMRKFEKLV